MREGSWFGLTDDELEELGSTDAQANSPKDVIAEVLNESFGAQSIEGPSDA